MKNSGLIGALIGSAVLLAGCDEVRVPGTDRGEDGPASEAPTTPADPVSEAGEDTTGGDATADMPAEDAPGGDDTATPGDGQADQSASEVEDTSPPPDVSSLAEINAATCGLPESAPPTETLAEKAGADAPQAEAMVGVATVGGIAARLASFPGIVKMEPRTISEHSVASGHCGATRIAENWFVTAAHCVDETYDEIRFIAGVENIRDEESATIFEAGLSVCHAGYDGRASDYSNDLALLRVGESEIDRLASLPIARFAPTENTLTPFNYPTAEMAGWGLTSENGSLSPRLLGASLDIVRTGPAKIVIASQEGAGPCIGDSGGPLFVTENDGEKTLVGVLSVVEQNEQGRICAGDYRGRYTNLQGYVDWIETVTAVCDGDPALCR